MNRAAKKYLFGEDQLLIGCMDWFKYQYPELKFLCNHAQNEGKRGFVAKSKAKHTLTAGWPDFELMYPANDFHGLFIELKTKTGRLTPVQRNILETLSHHGYQVEVCRNLEEFMKTINEYLS